MIHERPNGHIQFPTKSSIYTVLNFIMSMHVRKWIKDIGQTHHYSIT